MIPKFRAYDGGSLNRMYQPDEVMVGNGDIWIIDEDSVAGEWIVNNDIHLMQSTGLFDAFGTEIFEEDIITKNEGEIFGVVRYGICHSSLCFYVEVNYKGSELTYPINPNFSRFYKVAGNIYKNPELLENKGE